MNKNKNRKCSRIKTLGKVFGQEIHLGQLSFLTSLGQAIEIMTYIYVSP